MLVNHIVSNDTKSAIFDAIFDYFRRFAPPGDEIVVSAEPCADAALHHYHRSHLEEQLSDRALVTVHHDLRDPDPWLDVEAFLARYREAAQIVCLNRCQQRFLRDRGITHTTVIPHGYNDEVLRPKPHQPRSRRGNDDKIVLGIFSKYYARRIKGEAYLHDLVKRLDPQRFAFVLVGEQRLVTAEALVDLGYEVRLFEYLPYRLFQSLYESIDYLLNCSNFDGGPANLAEAMATHTPVIASAVGIAPDFIDDGTNGLLLTQDPDVDGERLARLADPSDSLAATIAAGARELRSRIPTWRDVIRRHFELYRSVLRDTPAATSAALNGEEGEA